MLPTWKRSELKEPRVYRSSGPDAFDLIAVAFGMPIYALRVCLLCVRQRDIFNGFRKRTARWYRHLWGIYRRWGIVWSNLLQIIDLMEGVARWNIFGLWDFRRGSRLSFPELFWGRLKAGKCARCRGNLRLVMAINIV